MDSKPPRGPLPKLLKSTDMASGSSGIIRQSAGFHPVARIFWTFGICILRRALVPHTFAETLFRLWKLPLVCCYNNHLTLGLFCLPFDPGFYQLILWA